MRIKKFIFGAFLLFILFLFFKMMTGSIRLPGFGIYRVNTNVMGGCIYNCEGTEGLIGCSGDKDDHKDSFASCIYYCRGKLTNNCD